MGPSFHDHLVDIGCTRPGFFGHGCFASEQLKSLPTNSFAILIRDELLDITRLVRFVLYMPSDDALLV